MHKYGRLVQMAFTVVIVSTLSAALPFAPASAQGNADRNATLLGAIWYVANTGSDANSCLVADSPCETINGALAKAALQDTIKVAIGTYTGTGTAVVQIDKNIILSGGWNAAFTAQDGRSTIDGQGVRSGVHVNSAPYVVIERFTIRNGSPGIRNYSGAIELNDSLVTRNVGGGIYNDGRMDLSHTLVTENIAYSASAGIWSNGSLTLSHSTVSRNTLRASHAGSGIYTSGMLFLSNSTVTENTGGEGEGVYVYWGTALLEDSTISANQSYGVTVHTATLRIHNSILATNGSGDCRTDDPLGTITSYGYNLIGNSWGCPFTPATGDLVGVDPKLGKLIGFPGYLPLAADSPAIDAADPEDCSGPDQRGVIRPVGVRCDIGAYEYAPPGSLARLMIANGDEQQTGPDMPFTHPLAVAALDSQGSPVSGVSVTFIAPASGPSGTFADTQAQSTTSITDANGVATASLLTANSLPGAYTVAASASGVEVVYFHLENKAWFVAVDGSDSNSCSTADNPCGTINGAIGKAEPGDIVRVAAGTYTGTGEEVVLIDKDITLSGGWSAGFTEQSGTSTIDGEEARRGITIPYSYPALVVTTTVERFTIQNGFGGSFGGGIHKSWGSLTLNDSMVINNVSTWMGGGIYSSGTLTINNTIISGNTAGQVGYTGGGGGAGIRHYQGTLTLNHSTVSNNTLLGSFDGSGIDANGTMLINNTTISGNTGSDGAGISTSAGTLILNNSTISFNQWYGILNRRAHVILRNTIIAMNGPGRDCHNVTVSGGTVTSHGYNLIGNGSTCTLTPTTGDQVGSDAHPIDPLLRPLQDTGGPILIHALMPGSPAIDAGNPALPGSEESACLATDQRGVTRPQGDRCDIGAYEYTSPGSLARLVIQEGDEQQTAPDMPFAHPLAVAALDGQGSPVSGVSVTFIAPASGPSATFADTQAQSTTSITDANGVATASLLTANSLLGTYAVAASAGGVETVYFNLHNKGWFVAAGGSDSNSCAAPDSPCGTINGAIGKAAPGDIVKVAAGTYTGTGNEVVLIDKDITLSGGWDQTFTSRNGSSIIDGETTRRGVYVDWGWNNYPANRVTASLDHFMIKNGSAGDGLGGGVANAGTLTITNSSIYSNSAAAGAGIWNSHDRILTLMNVTISNNSASGGYGGIWNDSGTVFLSNSTITANSGDSGAGIRSEHGMTYLRNSIIAGNLGNDCNGRGFSAQGNNLIGNNENCALKPGFSNDLVGTPAAPIDPRLGSLQDNGGSTFTHALLADSPAIDAGPEDCGPFDQRGVPRPQGDRCDIGAYEVKESIEISIAGNFIDSYLLRAGESKRVSFPGINTGPLKITDINSAPLIAAARVIYRVRGVNTSFSEMMALPASQLDTTYWLPWYNNVDLDTQLRFANVTDQTAAVHVWIGNNEVTPVEGIVLPPGASTRVSYAGVNNGPVKIVSDQAIAAAERVVYKVDNTPTSFSEMMALPAGQLDTTYWLPWYNNVDLDTQLRIANVSGSPATVTVTIGGVAQPSFTLASGESTRKRYPGVNAGPVQIASDQAIVAAQRVIYRVHGVNTSFSEMMALPAGQLDTTYWLPWYNNRDLDTQLRFANTTSTPATVRIYIGGVEMQGSPFTLPAGESTRKSFPGFSGGPVQIVSDVPIAAAERVIFKVNNVNTSFTELMALPASQLDTTYWFPWYNNVDLDTQLRFGVP